MLELAMALAITSPAFANSGPIDARYTCEGADLSPELQWTGKPPRTSSFALIVDDHPSVLDILGKVARGAGFDVRACAGGREAIDSLRARKPHLAFIDVKLPDVGGIEVLKTISPQTSPSAAHDRPRNVRPSSSARSAGNRSVID